jgi:hypothetical protein
VTGRPAEEIYLCVPDPSVVSERLNSEAQLQSVLRAMGGF